MPSDNDGQEEERQENKEDDNNNILAIEVSKLEPESEIKEISTVSVQ